ncbi:MAG TPA: type 4a pilus biogenesis protein PilO [Holophagaceae bacterium]|nr:type 4a pilus biogenesis protein PilO [Holophagaceae bacterium]
MNPNLQKQIVIGAVAGLIVAGLTYFLLGGKRTDRDNLVVQNGKLEQDVAKGKELKKHYEQLKEEVGKLESELEQLIKLMPTDTDTGEIPYKIKKLADNAGIDQTSFNVKGERRDKYYTERTLEFTFRGGFNSFGAFASQVSGYDKIISISNIEMAKITNVKNSPYSMTAKTLISAYVYNPEPAPAPAAKPGPKPAGKPAGKESE